MKKTMLWGLIALMLMTCSAGAFAQEQEGYYAVAHWRPEQVAELNLTEEEAGRIIYVSFFGAYGALMPMLLPEGEVASEEAYNYVGLRVYLDNPLVVEQEGNRVISVTMPEVEILRPSRVEIVGTVSYGLISEIGEDYVVQDVWYDTANNPNEQKGLTSRYTITLQTLQCYENPFEAGSGCEMIVDEDGNALTMLAANG